MFFLFEFFIKLMDFLWLFEFCGKTSVLTMSSQDEIKEAQRKSAFVVILWWMERHFCKMAALMFRCLFFKRLVFHENEPSSFIFIYFLYIYIFFFCPLD